MNELDICPKCGKYGMPKRRVDSAAIGRMCQNCRAVEDFRTGIVGEAPLPDPEAGNMGSDRPLEALFPMHHTVAANVEETPSPVFNQDFIEESRRSLAGGLCLLAVGLVGLVCLRACKW